VLPEFECARVLTVVVQGGGKECLLGGMMVEGETLIWRRTFRSPLSQTPTPLHQRDLSAMQP
jgi:hypothetical protein